jgi:hypothetical protein
MGRLTVVLPTQMLMLMLTPMPMPMQTAALRSAHCWI